jgi:hypothetical protein
MIDPLPALFGGVINSLTVRVEPWVNNWLTTIWILGLGALAGILVVAVLWALGLALSRIGPLSQLSEKRTYRVIAGVVIGAVLLGVASPWLMAELRERWANDPAANRLTDALWMFLPAALGALIVGWGLIVLCGRRTFEELPLLFQEGPLFAIATTLGAFALFGILGTVLVRDPETMLDSLRRWPSLGKQTYELQVAASKASRLEAPPEETIMLSPPLRRNEVRRLTFQSNESLRVSAFSIDENANVPQFDVSGGEPLEWSAGPDPRGPFGDLAEVDRLFVRNYGDGPATLTLSAVSGPATPEMLTVPIVAAGVVGLFLMFIVLWGLLPKLSAIAFATAKSEMNTPLFKLLTVLGALAIFVFMWLPYNTFGEDIKMLKFAVLDLMLAVVTFQAVWSASNSISDEVEGRTALTVLSKPVARRDFILGKFLGIAWVAMVMFTVFTTIFLLCVAYKPIFDVREGGKAPVRPTTADPLGLTQSLGTANLQENEMTWQICHAETASTIPAVMLVYFEALVMAAVSVAISTRLSLVANVTICLAIYALGHLTPLLVQASVVAERFEAVIFMGQLIAAVLPVLEYFDVKAAIAKGTSVSLAYVGATFVYTVLYASLAMLLSLVLFEDRDLA